MSFTKMVRLFCDGPDCRAEVYGESADEARRVASRLTGWYKTAKYGKDFHTVECWQNWVKKIETDKSAAELASEVRPGTLDTATVHHT